MSNTRSFCNDDQFGDSLVNAKVEVRDSLGTLAVQVLASREGFSSMSYPDMIKQLHEIVCDLHAAFDEEYQRLP